MPTTTHAVVTQKRDESLKAVIERARSSAASSGLDVIIELTVPPCDELRIHPTGELRLRAHQVPNERLASEDVNHVNDALGLAIRTGSPVMVSCYNHPEFHATIDPSMSEAEALRAYYRACDHLDHGD